MAREEATTYDKLAGEVEKQYKEGLSFLRKMGYLDKWPEYERFRAGDQWPPATPRTKSLPRPVFNLIKMIETHKVANVMSEQINMLFSREEADDTMEQDDTGDLFSRYSAATWERVKQDDINEEALDIAANTGTVAVHYHYDMSIQGGVKFPFIGEMDGEVIDPINIFFGNEQQRNVQRQPYIIISSRESVNSVREYARKNGMSKEMVSQIKPDKDTEDEGYDLAKVEIDDSKKIAVITKYWKGTGGEIMFCKIAGGMTIKKPTNTMLTRYPIAVMQWERRKKSIRGIGDTEGLIPNQKAVNTLVAMQILSVQLTGWPKLIYKKGAIDPSKVTNAPGEMIEDHLPVGQGDGAKYLTPGNISAVAGNLVEAILTYTRQMTGADEAATGSAPSADLNATAIMLLQKASAIPIESIKRRFYSFIEDIGRIWEDIWKVKYNLPRQVTLKDDDGEEYPAMFDGSQYQEVPMSLKIDVGPSSTYSESLMLSSLDKALDRGDIDYMQYLKYAPHAVVPFRDRLMKEMEEKKGVIGQMEQLVASMQPEEREMFQSMPPDQQFMFLQQNILAPQVPQAVPNQPTAVGM
ncbi:portal protein [Paenibacillus sp. FSL R10-2771]|uniref:portal protein n=1 Tax=Paenibacillus sp. FSL R10-2771 TaxID=2954693 RepID=UPI0030F8E48E